MLTDIHPVLLQHRTPTYAESVPAQPPRRRASWLLTAGALLLLASGGAVAQGTTVKLNAPIVAGGDVGTTRISPDNTTVVFRADQDVDGVLELFSVPLEGGTVTRLNAVLLPGESVDFCSIGPDGGSVVYVTAPLIANNRQANRGDGPLPNRLFSVPITGGVVTQLSPQFEPGVGISHFAVSPDSSVVAYKADQDTTGMFELFGRTARGGDSIKLNAPLVTGGDVSDFWFSPNSNWIIYRADQETDGVDELFSLARGTLGVADALFSDRFEEETREGWTPSIRRKNPTDPGCPDFALPQSASCMNSFGAAKNILCAFPLTSQVTPSSPPQTLLPRLMSR